MGRRRNINKVDESDPYNISPYAEMLEAKEDFPHLVLDLELQLRGQLDLSQEVDRLYLHRKTIVLESDNK